MQRHRHDPYKNLVGFVVGEVDYAIAIARVREISNPLGLVALPHAPRSVIGVADYRGEVVPVVDLRRRFGLAPTEVTRKTKWLIIDVGPNPGGEDHAEAASTFRRTQARTRPPETESKPLWQSPLLALVVDAVTEVFGTGGADLRPAPGLGAGEDARGLAGVASHRGGLVFVLDTGRMRDLAEAVAAVGIDSSLTAAHGLSARSEP
jgi:purine-binding chemotaxis protein CheW